MTAATMTKLTIGAIVKNVAAWLFIAKVAFAAGSPASFASIPVTSIDAAIL